MNETVYLGIIWQVFSTELAFKRKESVCYGFSKALNLLNRAFLLPSNKLKFFLNLFDWTTDQYQYILIFEILTI